MTMVMCEVDAKACADRVVESGHMCYGCPAGTYCGVSAKFNATRRESEENIFTTEVIDLVDQHLQPKLLDHTLNNPAEYNRLMVAIYMNAARRHLKSLESHWR